MSKIPQMATNRIALVFTLQLCSLFTSPIWADQDFPPRLTHQPHSVRIKLNDPQAIECPIESEPASDVKWFKDGQVLTSEPAHLELMGAELMFTKFNEDDAGEYHCEARNYLGRVASDRFRLTVQSNVQDESLLLEPQVYSAVELQDWPAEFHCTIPTGLLGRLSETWQAATRSQPEQFVRWYRNGRPLSVTWDFDDNKQEPVQQQRSFRSRQSETNLNEFILSISRPSRQLDNNSTFTCRLKWKADGEFEEFAPSGSPNELHESRPALLRIELPAKRPVVMDIPMGPPIGNISGSPTPSGGENWNHSTQLSGAGKETTLPPSGPAEDANNNNNRIRQSLTETLSDLYQIAKPTLILFGIMCLVAVIVLFQFLFVRRRAEAHRYMKHGHHHHHHQYSSSGSSATSQAGANCGAVGGGGGSGASSALGDVCDPVLSSLLARTLSAPSASSLSGATKKYKYYRDHMRGKVAAAVTSDHQLVLEGNHHHDFLDAAAYFAAATHQRQPLDCQSSLFAVDSTHAGPNSAVPNLYNQSLAAREQARSLLQSGEHVRSMGNLTASGQLQRLELPVSKQHEMIMAANGQRLNGFNQLQHHFEPPLNFPNASQLNGPLESGAASLLHQHSSLSNNSQRQQQLWSEQRHNLLLTTANNHQAKQQQRQMNSANEQYQLVSCSSVSPSSTSSIVVGSNSSSGTGSTAAAAAAAPGGRFRGQDLATTANSQLEPLQANRDSVSNHYSIIDNNDDEDERRWPVDCGEDEDRYEEVDAAAEFVRSSVRSSAASKTSAAATSNQTKVVSENVRNFDQRKSTFGMGEDERRKRRQADAESFRRISNESASSSSNPSTGNATQRMTNNKLSSGRTGKKQRAQPNQTDQLSPYAVSSICHNQPPPISSEAMRALKEQFDINQLVMIDKDSQQRASNQHTDSEPRLPFSLPPPPSPPSVFNCDQTSDSTDGERPARTNSTARIRARE